MEIINDNLATKLDIEILRQELQRDMKELEMRMIIKLGTIMLVAVGAVATLVKIL